MFELDTYAKIQHAVNLASAADQPHIFQLVSNETDLNRLIALAVECLIRCNGRLTRYVAPETVTQWLQATYKRGKAAMLDRNGGTVSNSYGFSAETVAVAIFAIPVTEGMVFVGWINRVPANNNARLACPHLMRSHSEYRRSDYVGMLNTALGRRIEKNAREAAKTLLTRPEFHGAELVGVFGRYFFPFTSSGVEVARHVFNTFTGVSLNGELGEKAQEFGLFSDPYDIGRWLVFADFIAENGLVTDGVADLFIRRLQAVSNALTNMVKK